MELLKWTNGRQTECTYKKLPLWFFRIWKFGSDAYILKYQEDTVLPEHKDPILGGKHWRLNIGYGKANFICENYEDGLFWNLGKFSIYFFRPDLYKHSLYVFSKTWKLSIGFVKFD